MRSAGESGGANGAERRAARPRILYLARRWVAAARGRLEEITRAHGLTAGDYTILSVIDRLGPCSAADIARALRVTPQAATQQVSQIEAKGMVSRYENEANRRIILIAFTERGRAAFRDIDARTEALEAELTDGLDRGQLALIHAFLSRHPQRRDDQAQ